MKQIKCKKCKKLSFNKKFCSNECKFKYFKKYKIGICDPKIRKKSHITNKKNKTGFWNSKVGKKGAESCRKKKTGAFHNLELKKIICSKGGRIGGLITAKILREKKCIYWKGNYFDSFKECEIGMNIYYQIEKLIEGKNYQKKINSKLIDFYIKRCDCFIEFHQILKFINPDETNENYYNIRRKILNNGGFRNSNLIIIK